VKELKTTAWGDVKENEKRGGGGGLIGLERDNNPNKKKESTYAGEGQCKKSGLHRLPMNALCSMMLMNN
jgi:hypothetical protein